MNKTKNSTRPQVERNELILDRFDLLMELSGMKKSHIINQLSEEYKLCYASIYYIVNHKQPKRYYIKKKLRKI